jgi:uncharacterized protein YbjT (DUF2867 family)
MGNLARSRQRQGNDDGKRIMKVAVFGATGVQGQGQMRVLAAQGHTPVAVARNPDGLAGVTRFGDFARPESVHRAIQGMDAVFLNLPSTSFQVAAPVIAAAELVAKAVASAPSVKMLVFNTSLPMAETKLGFAAQDARIEMRSRIFASGAPAVVLQPTVYLDNLLNGWAWPAIAKENTVVYPHGETLDVTWICHDDLAALMIAAAERPYLAGRHFPVAGPETVRLPELARRLSTAWGRNLGYRSQPVAEFCNTIAGVFEGKASLDHQRLVGELGRLYTWYNTAPERPFYLDMEPVLKELPAKLTSIVDWAKRQKQPAG